MSMTCGGRSNLKAEPTAARGRCRAATITTADTNTTMIPMAMVMHTITIIIERTERVGEVHIASRTRSGLGASAERRFLNAAICRSS
jgi:hypothetical protein